MRAKKGQILEISCGSYDDYGVMGIFIVRKSFDDTLIKELVGTSHTTFFQALIREGYIREHKKGVIELHLGSSFCMVESGAHLNERFYNLEEYMNESE